MSRLIILGNGFDLHYGLPTQYKNHLVPILKEKNEKFFKILDSIYFNGNPELWKDFEGEIGALKDDEILHEKFREDIMTVQNIEPDSYPPGHNNYGGDWMLEYSAANEASEKTPDFQTAFRENNEEFFDNAFSFLEDGLREMCYAAQDDLDAKISDDLIRKDFNFCNDDSFITFNYTNTLEKIYDFIPEENILHIHESLESGEELIFGNTQDKLSRSDCYVYEEHPYFSPESVDEAETESMGMYIRAVTLVDYDFNDYNNSANEHLDRFNETFIKDIQSNKLVQFLSDKTISEIWIFGTSIGDVDIPYYRYINSKYPSANWYIAYFKDEDYTSISTIMEPLLGSNVDYLRTDEFLNKL